LLLLGRLFAVLISGLLLAQAYGLTPFWLLAWLAPIPFLIAVLGASRLEAFAYGAAVGAFSVVGMFSYLAELGGVAPAIIVSLAKALIWGGLALAVRGAARHLPAAAAVFAFPLLMAGVETLIAAVSPHGSAGSLAYSQMNFPALIQVAALGGAPAIAFAISAFAAAFAFMLAKRAILAAAVPLALVALGFGYGQWRIAQAPASEPIRVTLIAGDQFEGVGDDWRAVWAAYAPQIERAADADRRVVLLPEKIAHVIEGERGAALAQLGEIAARRDLLLVAGVDDETRDARFNRAYAFTPDAVYRYDKRHMIPGFEAHFRPGAETLAFDGASARFGVAICKDMDFPALGRAYAGVDIVLVPAWDFGADAWLHSRMAMLRGVESGYAVVRSAREGVLTVSDAYGRVLAEAPSGPQTAFNAEVPSVSPRGTLYARVGDVFGWACLLLALVLIGWSAWAGRRSGQGE